MKDLTLFFSILAWVGVTLWLHSNTPTNTEVVPVCSLFSSDTLLLFSNDSLLLWCVGSNSPCGKHRSSSLLPSSRKMRTHEYFQEAYKQNNYATH